jgi:autotransporter-associated beta strand protein
MDRYRLAVVVALLTSGPVAAAQYFWTPVATTGVWTTPNWHVGSNNAPYDQPWADGNTANFTGAGQTITVSAPVSVDGINVTGTGILIDGSSTLTLGTTTAISVSGSNLVTVSAAVAGSSGLTKIGTGTLVLSGANTYTGGTIITGGTLAVGNVSALGSTTGAVVVNSPASLDLGGASITVGALSGSGTVTNSLDLAATFTVNNGPASSTFSGVISGSAANPINLNKAGGGTLALTGTNTYTGTTTVSAGTLSIGNGGTSGSIASSAVTVQSGATLGFNRSNNLSYAGSIGGAGDVTKQGAGTLTLGGTSGYTGTTSITGGTLSLTGSLTGTSLVSVTGSGTLAGTGTINGPVTIESLGTVSPGLSPGPINTGVTTFGPGGHYNWQVQNAAGTAGNDYDTINATSLTITATGGTGRFNINLWSLSSATTNGPASNFDPNQSQSWTLVKTSDGGVSGFSPSFFQINVGATNGTGGFQNSLNGGTFAVAVSGGNLILTFTPVPEPGCVLLVAGMAFGVGRLVVKRRRARAGLCR